MKTLYIFFALFFCVACSKDQDNAPDEAGSKNSFTFQNSQHPTKSATYQYVVNNTAISLTSNDPDNQIILLFKGISYDAIQGNYTYKEYFDPTFDMKSNFADMTLYLGKDIYEDFDKGNISISKQGNMINITYSFSGSSGTVSGSYSGIISIS